MDALILLAGIVFGAAATYYMMNQRINDYQFISQTRVEDFKESFKRGYETRNGITPFVEENAQNEPISTYLEDENIEEYTKPERWDD